MIEDVIEPYLMQQGFVQRTPRGRLLTEPATAISACRRAAGRGAARSAAGRRSTSGGGAVTRGLPPQGRVEDGAHLFPCASITRTPTPPASSITPTISNSPSARAPRCCAARHRAWRACGAEAGIMFVVRRSAIDYLSPGAARRRARRGDAAHAAARRGARSRRRKCAAATTVLARLRPAHRLHRRAAAGRSACRPRFAAALASLIPPHASNHGRRRMQGNPVEALPLAGVRAARSVDHHAVPAGRHHRQGGACFLLLAASFWSWAVIFDKIGRAAAPAPRRRELRGDASGRAARSTISTTASARAPPIRCRRCSPPRCANGAAASAKGLVASATHARRACRSASSA